MQWIQAKKKLKILQCLYYQQYQQYLQLTTVLLKWILLIKIKKQ